MKIESNYRVFFADIAGRHNERCAVGRQPTKPGTALTASVSLVLFRRGGGDIRARSAWV